MEAQSLETPLTMELCALDERFVRTAVMISRSVRGAWDTTLESDIAAEVHRVTAELTSPSRALMLRSYGAVALRDAEQESMPVGYAFVHEAIDSVWFGGIAVVPQELGKGITPAVAQAALVAANRNRMNKLVQDPSNVLPALLEGALDDANNYSFSDSRPAPPVLPANPRISDVQLALMQAYPNLAEYDVKKS